MKKLLFVLSKYENPLKNAIVATCAWIVKERDYLLEVYYDNYRTGRHYCGEPFRFKNNRIPVEDYFGSTVLGGFHHEQFYFLNNACDVEYLLLDTPTVFESSIRTFGKPIIATLGSVADFYKETFTRFGLHIPSTATALAAGPSEGFPLGIDSLSYPEIFYRQSLGVIQGLSEAEWKKFVGLGVRSVILVGGDVSERQRLESYGLHIEEEIPAQQDSGYAKFTTDQVERWDEEAKEISLCDPVLAAYWIPWLCRHETVPIFSFDVQKIIPRIVSFCKSHDQRVVFGRQNSDRDILELSRQNITLQIVDPNRPPFPVIEKIPHTWQVTKNTYPDPFPDDRTLNQWADEGKVLASLVFHCGDARHTDIIPRVMDFVAMNKLKIGAGITAHWYTFVPELWELIHVPVENGGLYPYVEPLLYSGGLGMAAEGKGYLDLAILRQNLHEARNVIQSVAGPAGIPKGYYTFLDIELRDWSKGSPDLYASLADQGFDYLLSSMNPGRSKVLFRKDDFVVINHSVPFFSFYSNFIRANNLDDIVNCEDIYRESGKPGWVIAALDSPIWGFEYAPWENGGKLKEMADYLTGGGNTGNLINVTPGVIARYARILDSRGLLERYPA